MTARPDSRLATNETTGLLQPGTFSTDSGDETSSQSSNSSSSSFIDNPSLVKTYGTLTKSDEEEQREPRTTSDGSAQQSYSNGFIAKVVIALLVGVFASSADGSLVIATHPIIASEFNDLENSSWLFISFLLAGAATQSLYGKLSDIYGRKSVLLVAYALFAIGSALIGVGQSMWQVIVGRVISGSGGAGLMSLAAVIITDLAPLRDVASWQSYLNVVATVGRSLGGPVGGFLADTIGWRWSFFGQAPLFILAMILCAMVLPNLTTRQGQIDAETTKGRLARIDFLGAIFLGSGLLAILLPLRIAGQKVPWTSPIVPSLLAAGAVLLTLFIITEMRWAKEPILPLRLLRNRDVVFSYLIMVCQTAAQVGMMFSVPLYFQVTQRSSSTVAGAHLIPAVIGNTIGGLLTGFWIRSGFGTGMSLNAVFVALQAAINPMDRAVAASGLYLSIPIGSMLGMASCNAVLQGIMPVNLASRLRGLGIEGIEAEQIIKEAAARVDYLDEAPKQIAQAVAQAYVRGLEFSHGVSLLCAVLATIAALLMRNRKLGGR
ncbi:MFS general substrate transporter [Annulohypoxylon bovei var. microspora]|nr:MFS general substrate transporter [Annulohypoxylon bovei var. microspora]